MKYQVSINVSEIVENADSSMGNTIGYGMGNSLNLNKQVEAVNVPEAVAQLVEQLNKLA